MEEEMRPQAIKRIETRIVLEAIAKAENIEISDEKMDEEISKMAESYKMVSYLCGQGHKKIGILAATPDDESIGRLRLLGYRKALFRPQHPPLTPGGSFTATRTLSATPWATDTAKCRR